jgi:hypothetical protein
MKAKTKRCCRGYEIDGLVERIQKLSQQVEYLQKTSISNRIKVYSAGNDVCIGMDDSKWHRIVCVYEGNRCLGGVRPHFQSTWSIDEKGFHLESMIDEKWEGWNGQYRKDNKLKYDQLDRKVLELHHSTLVKHIQTMGIWYPCHIYNDFTGELYRP